jgi:hypothetical protein
MRTFFQLYASAAAAAVAGRSAACTTKLDVPRSRTAATNVMNLGRCKGFLSGARLSAGDTPSTDVNMGALP